MTKIYTKFKNTALIGMMGAMSLVGRGAHAAQPDKTPAPVVDTVAYKTLTTQLNNQYAQIESVLKTLIKTMNSPDIDRKSAAYQNISKMVTTLMQMIKNKDEVMSAANRMAGKPSQSSNDITIMVSDLKQNKR